MVMTLILSTFHTLPLMKTLMMRKEGLEEKAPRDDLRDLKAKDSKFDGNLNPENYLGWIQAIERMFGLKEYNDEKSSKFSILKLKGYTSLWYEHLKNSRLEKPKSKIKT